MSDRSSAFSALRGRLLPGAADGYIAAHDQIPRQLLDAQRDAGVRRWLIFQDGLDLFHVAECDDFDNSMRSLGQDPRDQSWQREMAGYKQPIDERGNTEARLKLIYERELWLPGC
ncbi:MAG: L-rhamnose mutarotase [Solirubrobacteraceae bacterium]